MRALLYLVAYSPNELISISVPPELYLFERRRPRVGIDQHQRRLLDPWAHAARPDVVPDRPEPHPLVQELLDLMEQRLAFAAIAHEGLFLVQRVDVGVAAVGIRPVARDVLRHPRGGVAVGRSGAHTEPPQLLGLQRRGVRGPLHRPHLQLDADGSEIAHDRLAHREIGWKLMQLPAIETRPAAGFGRTPPRPPGLV